MRIVLTSIEQNNQTVFLEFGKVLQGRPGLSSYDLWLQDGNTGSLADYYRFLQQPAIDAANVLFSPDMYNITTQKPLPQGSYYSFTDAGSDFFIPNHVPVTLRKDGIMVVAKLSETEWMACQFRGDASTSFTDKSAWTKIFPLTEADVAHLLVLPLRMEVDTQGDSFLAWGETMTAICRVYRGFEDVTDHVATWSVVRSTGNEVDDAAWLLKSKVLNFSGTLDLSYSLSDNDLSTDSSVSTLFLFNAIMSDGFIAQYELII